MKHIDLNHTLLDTIQNADVVSQYGMLACALLAVLAAWAIADRTL